MRLVTWNINGLRARLEFLRLWLAEERPDVVGLQELKLRDDQFPHQELADVGYHAEVFGQPAWNGVAVLSRTPVEVVQCGLPGQEAMGARYLAVTVAGLRFATFYCPNGKHVGHPDFERKLAWLEDLARELDPGRDATPTIACGDLNVCPGPLDSWNEERFAGSIFHTAAERERVQRLLDLGFVDAYRVLEPDGRDFSWWDYRAGSFHRGHGLRIDLLFASRQLTSRLRSVEVRREWRKKRDGLTPSDHAPVVLELS